MNTHTQVQTNCADTDEATTAHMLLYRFRLLTPEYEAVMLDDIRAAVSKAVPRTLQTASAWATVLSSFVADTAPAAGCPLDEVLTGAKVASWVADGVTKGRSRYTMATRCRVLNALLRGHRGVAIRINNTEPCPLGQVISDVTSPCLSPDKWR